MDVEAPKKRGFAGLSPEKRREIAAKGGRALLPEQRSFSQNRALAAEAGRAGGNNVDPAARAFAKNRELAAEAGRKGGRAGRRRPRCGTCDGAGEIPSTPNALDIEDMLPLLPCPECGGTGDG